MVGITRYSPYQQLCGVNDKMLAHIPSWKDIYAICYTVKRLTVLQKNILAAVDFVKQSWKKEGNCFCGPSASHTDMVFHSRRLTCH